MNTLLFILAGVSIATLLGAAPVYFAFKNAATGYEDENGFHTGVQPAPLALPIFEPPVAPPLENRVITFHPAKIRAPQGATASAGLTVGRGA